ncbi:MAG: DUF3347 domain-containing protein, partial [Planctomycetota bacterium]
LGAAAAALLAWQQALAGDDAAAAAAAAEGFAGRLGEVSMELLEGPAHRRWMELAQAAGTAAAAGVAAAADIAAGRAAFRDASAALVAALDAFGFTPPADTPPLGVFHCPMAFDGAGADWLGAGDEVHNPYYGAAMPRCGELVRRLGRED